VKKLLSVLNVAVLLMAGLLILAGCSDDSDSSSSSSSSGGGKTVGGKGVLGQVSGVVYNSITAQPLDGVTVEMGAYKTTTDKNGNYLFKDVGPGTYTISYVKDGFQFRTKNVDVDPGAYITDDPFAEYKALTQQFLALQKWAEALKVIPDYASIESNTPAGGNTVSWTYNGGLTVDGNSASITVNNQTGQFEFENVGLDFTYSKAYPMYITSLAPLTGAIKVQVKLFNGPNTETFRNNVTAPVPVAEGTEFWFTEASTSNIGWGQATGGAAVQPEYNAATGVTAGTVRYGPGKANKNGEFTITGLPVGTALTLITNGFVQKINNVDYYFASKTTSSIYQYANDATALSLASTFTAQYNSVDNKVQNYTNAGTVYLFSEGSFVLVSSADVGTIATPKKPTDSIKLTFSDAIDKEDFTASLEIPVSGGNTNATLYGVRFTTATTITFDATWSADYKEVTLVPRNLTSNLRPLLPYAVDGTTATGYLKIIGYSQNRGRILVGANNADTNSISVYTEEAIKLVDVLTQAGETSSRAIVTVTRDTVDLVFNKPINLDLSRFYFGDSYDVGQQLNVTASADKKTISVPATLLGNTDPGKTISFRVVSASDPYDITLVNSTNTYRNPSLPRMILLGTNIYDSGFLTTTGKDAKFPTNKAITLTFDRDLPAGLTASDIFVYLGTTKNKAVSDSSLSSDSVSLSKTWANNTLTITPTVDLLYKQDYYLCVVVKRSTDEYFRTRDLTISEDESTIYSNVAAVTAITTIDSEGIANIIFTTADGPASYVNARSATVSSATSKQLTTVTSTAVTAGGSVTDTVANRIVANTWYFVQFDGTLEFTAPAVTTAVGNTNGTSDNAGASELSFRFEQRGDDVLAFMIVSGVTTEKIWTGVGLDATAKIDSSYGNTAKNGAINTQGNTFNISGLTVYSK